jgi:hypothetical protein
MEGIRAVRTVARGLLTERTRERRPVPLSSNPGHDVSSDAGEAVARQQARRFGLLLMVGSSVLSIIVLAGLWFLLRHIL